MAEAAHRPHANDVGNAAGEDSSNEEDQADLGFDANNLAKVAGLGEKGEAKRLGKDAGKENNHGSTALNLGEASGHGGGSLAGFVLNVTLQNGKDAVRIASLTRESALRRAGLFDLALADEVDGALRDDEGDGQGNGSKDPLGGKGDGVAVGGGDKTVNDEGADELADEGEDGEEGEERAAKLRRSNLGEVGLASGHHHTEGDTLDAFAGEKGAAAVADFVGILRAEADGDGDGGENGRDKEGGLATGPVLKVANKQRANHHTTGGDESPETKP